MSMIKSLEKKLHEAFNPDSLEIINESLIPEEFWNHPTPRLDRAGLISALKEGGSVPGATLGNGGLTISVRSK